MSLVRHAIRFADDVADRVINHGMAGLIVEPGAPGAIVEFPSPPRLRQFLAQIDRQDQ